MRHGFPAALLGIFLAFVLFAAPGTAAAQKRAQITDYRSCLDLANAAPGEAFDQATNWLGLGGGDGARHCQAVALAGLGQYREAADRLETLAQSIRAQEDFRARLLGQAAQAWLLAGDAIRADAVLTAALKIRPGDPELLIDRAQAAAARNIHKRAIEDLNSVLTDLPNHVEALVYRASAYRLMAPRTEINRRQAMADVERALRLDPDHVNGLLERGNLHRLGGNKDAARRDWLRVIARASGSPAADAARRNLERMDGPGGK